MFNAYDLFESIDVIVDSRLQSMKLDRTLICQVVDDSMAPYGRYKVQYGDSNFLANNGSQTYTIGDIVYVGVPADDYSNAFIISKKISELDNIDNSDPYKDFIQMTTYQKQFVADVLASTKENYNKATCIWSSSLIDNTRYGNLGLEFILSSNLPSSISYGFIIQVKTLEPLDDETTYERKSLFTFTANEMIGNIRKYLGDFSQKKLVSLDGLGPVTEIKVFLNIDGDLNTLKPDEHYLKIKKVKASFGYLLSTYQSESLYVYTDGYSSYKYEQGVARPELKASLRWIYVNPAGKLFALTETNKEQMPDASIIWYRYIDNDWVAVDTDNSFSYTFTPDKFRAEEQLKCCVEYEAYDSEQPIEYTSNILSFKNRSAGYGDLIDDKSFKLTTTSLQDFSSYYNPDGSIVDIGLSKETREVEASFAMTRLTEADMQEVYIAVTWKIPYDTKTMLSMVATNTQDEDNYITYTDEVSWGDLNSNVVNKMIEDQPTKTIDGNVVTLLSCDWNTLDASANEPEKLAQFLEDISFYATGFGNSADQSYLKTQAELLFRSMIYPQEFTKEQREETSSIVTAIDNKAQLQSVGVVNKKLAFTIKDNYIPSLKNNTITCDINVIKKGTQEILQTDSKTISFNFIRPGVCPQDYVLALQMYNTKHEKVRGIMPGQTASVEAILYDGQGTRIDTHDLVWTWLSPTGVQDDERLLKLVPVANSNLCTITASSFALDSGATDYHILHNFAYILQCAFTEKVDGEQVARTVVGYLPIGITNNSLYGCLSGPSIISYDVSGGNPSFYQGRYRLLKNNPMSTEAVNIQYKIAVGDTYTEELATGASLYPRLVNLSNDATSNTAWLRPRNTFIKEANLNVCVIATWENAIQWIQPLLITQSNSFSSFINEWDGSFTLDKEGNQLMAARLGAGKKEEDGTFSGVLLGDWTEGTSAAQTGVFGFDHGEQSYGLKEDGTAFFGKATSGRINFNGNEGLIYSNNFDGLACPIKYITKEPIAENATYISSAKTIGLPGNSSEYEYTITVPTPSLQHITPLFGSLNGTASSAIFVPCKNSGGLNAETTIYFKLTDLFKTDSILDQKTMLIELTVATPKIVFATFTEVNKDTGINYTEESEVTETPVIKIKVPDSLCYYDTEGILASADMERYNELTDWNVEYLYYAKSEQKIMFAFKISEDTASLLKDKDIYLPLVLTFVNESEYSQVAEIKFYDFSMTELVLGTDDAPSSDLNVYLTTGNIEYDELKILKQGETGTFINLKNGQLITNTGEFRGKLIAQSLQIEKAITLGDIASGKFITLDPSSGVSVGSASIVYAGGGGGGSGGGGSGGGGNSDIITCKQLTATQGNIDILNVKQIDFAYGYGKNCFGTQFSAALTEFIQNTATSTDSSSFQELTIGKKLTTGPESTTKIEGTLQIWNPGAIQFNPDSNARLSQDTITYLKNQLGIGEDALSVKEITMMAQTEDDPNVYKDAFIMRAEKRKGPLGEMAEKYQVAGLSFLWPHDNSPAAGKNMNFGLFLDQPRTYANNNERTNPTFMFSAGIPEQRNAAITFMNVEEYNSMRFSIYANLQNDFATTAEHFTFANSSMQDLVSLTYEQHGSSEYYLCRKYKGNEYMLADSSFDAFYACLKTWYQQWADKVQQGDEKATEINQILWKMASKPNAS